MKRAPAASQPSIKELHARVFEHVEIYQDSFGKEGKTRAVCSCAFFLRVCVYCSCHHIQQAHLISVSLCVHLDRLVAVTAHQVFRRPDEHKPNPRRSLFAPRLRPKVKETTGFIPRVFPI